MTEPDELYSLRNFFWLGAWQRAVSEGSSLTRLPETLKIESREFVYRSYIALGQQNIVLTEVPDGPSTPVALQAVKLLARYQALPAEKEAVLATLNDWLGDPNYANSATLQLMGAIIFLSENNTKDALRCIHLGTTMEHLALTIQIFLRMNRPDLANKQLRLMQQADEDAALTQLASAWVNLAQGGAKLQEAAYIFDELIDKFGSTVTLLNGVAAAHIQMDKFDEAEKYLMDAISKGQNDPDTLINLICCYQHMGKSSDLVNRYVSQLKTVAPSHPFVAQLSTVEAAFDRVSASFAQT